MKTIGADLTIDTAFAALADCDLMPRPLRIEYAGAQYHVISRGDRREAIFLSDSDRAEDFLFNLRGHSVKLRENKAFDNSASGRPSRTKRGWVWQPPLACADIMPCYVTLT